MVSYYCAFGLSQSRFGGRSRYVDVLTKSGDSRLDVESLFAARYERVARLIGRVIRNPGRAEELAAEVFLKYSRIGLPVGGSAEGWLYRTATRMAVDELRRQARRIRYEPLLRLAGRSATPEEVAQRQ